MAHRCQVVEPPAGRFVIGVWGGQQSHDVRGYYAAGKRLPSWVLAFSLNATEVRASGFCWVHGNRIGWTWKRSWILLPEVIGVDLSVEALQGVHRTEFGKPVGYWRPQRIIGSGGPPGLDPLRPDWPPSPP